MCKARTDFLPDFIHIGGMTTTAKSKTQWYWVANGEKINYAMEWMQGEPNNFNDDFCLSIGTLEYQFNDINCHTYEMKFICQESKTYSCSYS